MCVSTHSELNMSVLEVRIERNCNTEEFERLLYMVRV